MLRCVCLISSPRLKTLAVSIRKWEARSGLIFGYKKNVQIFVSLIYMALASLIIRMYVEQWPPLILLSLNTYTNVVSFHTRRAVPGISALNIGYGVRSFALSRPQYFSHIISHPTIYELPTAYMLLKHVSSDGSQMLSNTFQKQIGDPIRRRRLFKGIARLMLLLAYIPQPRIGLFRFYNNGTITLTNRPLSCTIMILENDGTPTTIQPNDTIHTPSYLLQICFVSMIIVFLAIQMQFTTMKTAVANWPQR